VKLVLVRTVVRARDGHAIGNLQKEDFQIFDDGKPQTITQFSVEQKGVEIAHQRKAELPSLQDNIAGKTPEQKVSSVPERYVAYLFDDVHLKFEDLARIHSAAERSLNALAPNDRAAILTTSGQTTLDFTADKAKLRATFEALRPHPRRADEEVKCPDLSLYVAYLIIDKHDNAALQSAINQLKTGGRCYSGKAGKSFIEGAAGQVLAIGEQESRAALDVLKDTVRMLSVMPGSRSIVLVSPGFLIPDLEYDNNEVIDAALRAQVIINALDARGLYVPSSVLIDTSQGFGAGVDVDLKNEAYTPASPVQLDQQAADQQKDVIGHPGEQHRRQILLSQ
jgi:VWFA-related protein